MRCLQLFGYYAGALTVDIKPWGRRRMTTFSFTMVLHYLLYPHLHLPAKLLGPCTAFHRFSVTTGHHCLIHLHLHLPAMNPRPCTAFQACKLRACLWHCSPPVSLPVLLGGLLCCPAVLNYRT